jgi:hypothetical protein
MLGRGEDPRGLNGWQEGVPEGSSRMFSISCRDRETQGVAVLDSFAAGGEQWYELYHARLLTSISEQFSASRYSPSGVVLPMKLWQLCPLAAGKTEVSQSKLDSKGSLREGVSRVADSGIALATPVLALLAGSVQSS